jgi:predicted nucleic acid-binding protein
VRAVIDTNVVAYLILGTEKFADEARDFMERVTVPLAPAHWESELANVIWMSTRRGVLPRAEAPKRLMLARQLGIESVSTATLCQGALLRALASDVAVYDTLFVELAVQAECRLATFDKTVLKTFPETAVRPGQLTA